MKRERLQAATVGGTADEVEQAFYEALNNADIEQLMSCWAEEDEIVCVHPSGQRWIGSGAIRSAFEALFAQGSLQTEPDHVLKIVALASAVHHLVERVHTLTPQGEQTIWVASTNVYHKTPQGWRLVAHHGSKAAAQDRPEMPTPPSVLH